VCFFEKMEINGLVVGDTFELDNAKEEEQEEEQEWHPPSPPPPPSPPSPPSPALISFDVP
jgi:hypothetical protein